MFWVLAEIKDATTGLRKLFIENLAFSMVSKAISVAVERKNQKRRSDEST